MANLSHGMSVESVRGIAKNLDSQAEQVQLVISSVDHLIAQAQSDWQGHDSQQFQQMWSGNYKGGLQRLKQEMNELAAKARRSAEEQERVSNTL